MKTLYKLLNDCMTEEEVKSEFAKFFKIKLHTQQRFDAYTEKILFEFKNQKNFSQLKSMATILAQLMYYLRELKYGSGIRPLPPYICAVDKNDAFISDTKEYKKFFEKRWGCGHKVGHIFMQCLT